MTPEEMQMNQQRKQAAEEQRISILGANKELLFCYVVSNSVDEKSTIILIYDQFLIQSIAFYLLIT